MKNSRLEVSVGGSAGLKSARARQVALARHAGHRSQRGVALVVSLLFLLVVSVISVMAASSSALGLKMSSNMADSYASFQSAEAGAIATLALAGAGSNDPFDGDDTPDPFAAFNPDTNHPLRGIADGVDAVDVNVFMTTGSTTCPRSDAGSSVGLFECDYYRIESEHEVVHKARTRVQLGVVKPIIGSGNL